MQPKKQLSFAISAALGLSASFVLPSVVLAQDQQSDESSDATLEEVIVTGSRIRRESFDTASPVSIVSSEQVKISGQTRIEDLLNQMPQIEAGQNSFISNGSTGTAELDLRGLGPNRTLVLVNGKRLQPGGHYGNAPDINQIPAALVDRVEVLTGGASATYGADAVAGVVNFIMKTDFEGLQIDVGAQGYQHKNDNSYIQGLMDLRGFDYPTGNTSIDGKSYNVDITMGSSFADGRGHATAYVNWRNNQELRQGSRDYSSCALNDAGTACGGSANAIVPNFILGLTDLSDYAYWTLDLNGNGFVTDSNLWNPSPYNYAPINHFQRPDTRYSMGAFVDYEVNDHVTTYLETMFMSDNTRAQIAESGTFFNTYYTIPLNSPTLSDLQRQQIADRFDLDPATDSFGAYIGKRNVEGGPRTDVLEHNSFRIVVGAKGDINDNWSYDVSYQHGQTSSSTTYINDFTDAKIITALDSNACAATTGCLVYDVFTLNGITPQQAAYVTGTGILKGTTKERIANGYVTGSVPITFPTATSPVSVVLGAETREEVFIVDADDVFSQGLLLGQGGATPSVSGSYNVDEFFTEAHIPIIEGNQDLSIDLAYRYSDYNLFGSQDTYKIAGEYQPMDLFRVRAGYNRAVRVPNVGELFTPTSFGLWTGTDPCSGTAAQIEARGFNQAQCANTGVTAAQYGNIGSSPASQYNAIYGGNANLKPEVADTYTIGVVVDPVDNLRFSLDWWKIEIKDVIATNGLGGELIVEQCAATGDPVFCNNVTRSATGSLWLGKTGAVTDLVVNQGTNTWEGVDLAARYQFDLAGGSMRLDLQGTRMITKETEPVPVTNDAAAAAVYDCVGDISPDCVATPKWRHIMTATYDRADWSANLRWRYQGKVKYTGDEDTIANDNLGAQNYFDISAGYTFDEHYSVLVGINNFLDKAPPLVGGTITSNANVPFGNYDPLGRQLFASLTINY